MLKNNYAVLLLLRLTILESFNMMCIYITKAAYDLKNKLLKQNASFSWIFVVIFLHK